MAKNQQAQADVQADATEALSTEIVQLATDLKALVPEIVDSFFILQTQLSDVRHTINSGTLPQVTLDALKQAEDSVATLKEKFSNMNTTTSEIVPTGEAPTPAVDPVP